MIPGTRDFICTRKINSINPMTAENNIACKPFLKCKLAKSIVDITPEIKVEYLSKQAGIIPRNNSSSTNGGCIKINQFNPAIPGNSAIFILILVKMILPIKATINKIDKIIEFLLNVDCKIKLYK